MTKETTKDAQAPKYRAYHVAKATKEGQDDRWNEIGVAFEHKDGAGINLILHAVAVNFDGKIVLRAPKAENGAGQ